MLQIYWLLLFSFVLSCIFYTSIIVVCKYYNLFDVPDRRKTHSKPVPVGGGIGFITTLVISAIILYSFYGISDLLLNVMIALGLFLSIVSFLDDMRSIGVVIRLICHFIPAFLIAFLLLDHYYYLLEDNRYVISVHNNMLKGILLILITFFIAGFLNIYNFMDGIDGLTGIETAHIFANFAIILGFSKLPDAYFYISLIIFILAISFLMFNWHPARLFIGDAGSIPIGFFAAFYLVLLVFEGYVLSALLVPMYYYLDGGGTLVNRMIRGEKFWLPHQKHFFQKAIKRNIKHSSIVINIVAFNVFITILNIIYIVAKPSFFEQLILFILGLVAGIFVLYKFSHKMT